MSTTIARHVSTDTIKATARHRSITARRRAVLRFRAVWAARIDRNENILIGMGGAFFLIGCAFAPSLAAVILGSL